MNLCELVILGIFLEFQNIMRKGPDIDYKANPLGMASSFGHTEIVKEFLKLGANVEHLGTYSQTPMCDALYYDNLETAKILLEHGANIDHVYTPSNITPLFLASKLNKPETVNFLLDSGTANIEYTDINGDTPLSIASRNRIECHYANGDISLDPVSVSKNNEVETLLLNKGAIVDNINNDQDTPLILSAKDNNITLIELLLERGAYPYHENSEGHIFLYYLNHKDRCKIEKFIECNIINKPVK